MSTEAGVGTDATYVTDRVKAFIGVEGEPLKAPEPVESGAIRRFAQAIMDDDPVYWDEDAARAAGYLGIVAPPLFPLHACRRRPGSPDPLDAAINDSNFDGASGSFEQTEGLPDPGIALKRRLNGGNEVRIQELATVGDIIELQSRFADIYEKRGRSGPLVFVITEAIYRATNRNADLLRSRWTHIIR